MSTADCNHEFLLETYGRSPICFTHGVGCELFARDGTRYLDCLAGLAVVSVGHGNTVVAEAIYSQAKKLTHVSNLFWTEPMLELASRLSLTAGGDYRCFFANSGAESIECAIKLARKAGGPGRSTIVCAEGSFHGRTLASLAATGQPKKWAGFEPLPTGFLHAPLNEIDAWDPLLGEETAAVLLECIQGEGGVVPASARFLQALAALCKERGILLMVDEIQSGVGRTGTWWSWQQLGIKPDIFTSAKALANGLPIGVCLAAPSCSASFQPGDHGSTFGGGPVVCSAALACLAYIEKEISLEGIQRKGIFLRDKLLSCNGVSAVRGRGLMLAAELEQRNAKAVNTALLAHGVIANNVTESALRFTPPLIINDEQMTEAVEKLQLAIQETAS